jgi:superfamily II DNA or RNA helicase
MAASFAYIQGSGVVLCADCQTCLLPTRSSQERHLRQPPHHLKGPQLRALLDLFATYQLLPPGQVALPGPRGAPVRGLRRYPAFTCSFCGNDDDDPSRLTRSRPAIEAHVSKKHRQKPAQQIEGSSWQRCTVQTFFAEKQHIRYFIVQEAEEQAAEQAAEQASDDGGAAALEPGEQDFFKRLDEDVAVAEQDAKAEANVVHGFGSHRSAVVPWLRRTGIEEHTRGLKKDEMHASFALPKDAESEPELFLMLEVMDEIFIEAHGWCFDGPDCMLTWPRQLALSRFHTAAAPGQKTRAFDPKKEPATLRTNFGYWKQLLTYCYRVVHRGGHFTGEDDDQRTPEHCIRLTGAQEKAWGAALRSALAQDRPALRDALLGLSMALVCHRFGGTRYSSPLLSFCAMLSVKPHTRTWKEPGNYNSCLSGVVWVVQLLIFYASASAEKAGLGCTLERIEQRCARFLRQDTETPMGEILGWRLLLFTVSKEVVGSHQAHWDADEKVLTYGDVDLHMDHVPELLLSEFKQAQHLLYDELMFGVRSVPRMRAWALKDNLDTDAFGWFFGQHRENAGLLRPLASRLRAAIQESKPLRDSFLDTAADGTRTWRAKAIAQYEAVADEFLRRLLVLIHMGAGQPLRESELFSVTWRNTQRRRNVLLKHGLVMLHTTYHKGQQQTGKFKDNVRFLPAPIGDLLLDYLVAVIPLRQVFLRQSAPHAVLSPYLWWKDGKVWADNRLTRCMEQASARADIPRLHIANWRQMTANIVKTKFAADIACFEVDDGADDEDAEEIEADIRAMTRQRNHTTRTVNRAYANQHNANFGNVWDGLIRRNLRASTLWKDLWGLDTVLGPAGKRKRADPESDGPQMLKKVAMGVYRPRKKWSSAALLKAARGLYRDDTLQWKSAAQERAMTTVMSWTEQVVAVLGTGEGKSLLFMLPCTLPDAGVTILVLPLVSLRGDLLRRVRELGIDHLVWAPGESRDAPLVFVSVEAASTAQFRTYTLKLAATQALGRIVFDEAHLTVTASDYRAAMVDLALIRNARTQFVYLTATLPPTIQATFEEQNNLVNPKVIRASTNRRNLFYLVQQATGRGGLLEEGARMARAAWQASGLLDQARDKIILYVRTKDEARDLAGLLSCHAYTAEAGTAEEKEELLGTWLAGLDQPYIVATSALSAGFDYAHVRLVMHINEPESLVDFAQESGRAGRDGKEAYSAVLLPSGWQSQVGSSTAGVEKKVLHRYLQGHACRRTCLSAYLDLGCQLRQCVAGEDVTCDVCNAGPLEPAVTEGGEDQELVTMSHTGSAMIQQKRRAAHLELSRYREDLLAVRGTCLLCRGLGEPWDHVFTACHQRFEFFKARDRVKTQREGAWIAGFQVCYWCYNPQSVCPRADPGSGCTRCTYADIVMPLCYGVFQGTGAEQWLRGRFQRSFQDIEEFLEWCGQTASFGGGKAIWAVRVAAAALVEFELY